jgi:hypothetical protein
VDSTVLVSTGHALLRALDEAGLVVRLAMWVHNRETDTWKLWLVPPKGTTDKHEFYRRVANVISRNRDTLAGLNASETEMIKDGHPAAKGLASMMKTGPFAAVNMVGNVVNGFYLPDGILLRSTR